MDLDIRDNLKHAHNCMYALTRHALKVKSVPLWVESCGTHAAPTPLPRQERTMTELNSRIDQAIRAIRAAQRLAAERRGEPYVGKHRDA